MVLFLLYFGLSCLFDLNIHLLTKAMKLQETIETLGRIIKVETLSSIDYNILPNTLVMENSEPFPGYFGHDIPKDSVPRSIFIITDKKYNRVTLSRIIGELKKETGFACDATTGFIRIYTKKYHCIRLNGLSCFDHIARIQALLKDSGIKFAKSKKIHESGRIVLNKYFKIIEVDDGLFKNLVQTEQYFIMIPRKLKWNQFYDITMKIKHNIDNKIFDAAIGYMYRENMIMDFIRIYDKDQSPERMKKIRDMYLHEINRLQ